MNIKPPKTNILAPKKIKTPMCVLKQFSLTAKEIESMDSESMILSPSNSKHRYHNEFSNSRSMDTDVKILSSSTERCGASFEENIKYTDVLDTSPIRFDDNLDFRTCTSDLLIPAIEASNMGNSSSASGCLDMSYLSNERKKSSGRRMINERTSRITFPLKQQEGNLFSIKRKRPKELTLNSDIYPITVSHNSSFESNPSVAKKVKFYPLITSTPTKSIGKPESFGNTRKALTFSDERSADLEIRKDNMNMNESDSQPLMMALNCSTSESFDKPEISPVLMDSLDVTRGNENLKMPCSKPPTISNLVEEFSCKIRCSSASKCNSNSNTLKRKIEYTDILSSDSDPLSMDNVSACNAAENLSNYDCGMEGGIGRYDAKYPADALSSVPHLRLGTIGHPCEQQYKQLKHSFDDTFKLAPIQETYRKSEVSRAYSRQNYVAVRLRGVPKCKLRRRYKSESDLIEKQPPGAPQNTNVVADVESQKNIAGTGTGDGFNLCTSGIKLYTLTDPERNRKVTTDTWGHPSGKQESVMEVFCEKMNDLQMMDSM